MSSCIKALRAYSSGIIAKNFKKEMTKNYLRNDIIL